MAAVGQAAIGIQAVGSGISATEQPCHVAGKGGRLELDIAQAQAVGLDRQRGKQHKRGQQQCPESPVRFIH